MKIEYGNKSRVWNKDSLKRYGEEIGFSDYGDTIYCVEKSNGEKLYFAIDSDNEVFNVKVVG